ncbi:hypothetical protein HK100_012082 [Physocladia obscura]|uniref:TauD/TfdA-like domain-containing protein n=1 Tax=Physocladia obscura TaxID=109957 RepID=A0AAD5XGI2_9FUNG|nr:hypothetical protein HK100_012082 [Physocladia obscura]
MSPIEFEGLTGNTAAISEKEGSGFLKIQPLKRNYSLDALYKYSNVEPHLGTEFEKGIQIRNILNSPDSNQLFHDLAVLVSERIVVFLRNQDLTFEEQKQFIDRLGLAAGKPLTSGLHSHPISDSNAEFGEKAYVISSDITFENIPSDYAILRIPSDYAILRIRDLPPEGGDTLWASAYEVYDRLSPTFQKFLEGLAATHVGEEFLNLARAGVTKLNPGPRGAPEDVGTELTAVHPVIRTNPVTGWKGVFANKIFTKRINDLSKDESDIVLEYLFQLAPLNHDIHVRFRWNKNDVAVWDNRSSYHAATADFDADAYSRLGERAASLGEKPYFDPKSKSRREALGITPPVARRAHLASFAATADNK